MTIRVSAPEAFEVATRVLTGAGAPHPQAASQAQLLVEGELRGHPSHGLLRLPRLVRRIENGVLDPSAPGDFHWTSTSVLDVDGQHGFGAVVACSALDKLIEAVPRLGVAAATIRNANHLGMLAHYAQQAAERGIVLIAMTTSEALVHPWGGTQALLGTNPLAVGVPADPPFVLDMATGIVSMGKIHAYAATGRPLEPGWALDSGGEPTLDAQAARSGAIAPFGGAKGYGLGLALELLVAGLTGTALGRAVVGTLDDEQLCSKGDLFIAFQPPTSLVGRLSCYLDEVRASGGEAMPVTVPGDRSTRRREAARTAGIDVPTPLWNELTDLATRKADLT